MRRALRARRGPLLVFAAYCAVSFLVGDRPPFGIFMTTYAMPRKEGYTAALRVSGRPADLFSYGAFTLEGPACAAQEKALSDSGNRMNLSLAEMLSYIEGHPQAEPGRPGGEPFELVGHRISLAPDKPRGQDILIVTEAACRGTAWRRP